MILATKVDSNDKETEVIMNSKLGFLYSHDFGDGRFFQTVHEDLENDTVTYQVAPRTMIKVVFLRNKNEIDGLHITKIINGTDKQNITLSKFNLAQIKAFLSFISQIDLNQVIERKISLQETDNLDVSPALISTLGTIINHPTIKESIEKWITEGLFTEKDIINTAYRKSQLLIFERLLKEETYWKEYCVLQSIADDKEEKALQKFLEKNDWIFGYGLDYRYKKILQREFLAGTPQADNKGGTIGDFLLADNNYTVFVELKTPNTKLFGSKINRGDAWLLSKDLFDSVSQIIAQKANGEIRINNEKNLTNDKGEIINQISCDSKTILIIGKLSEISGANEREKLTKRKTFEFFRRDSRNVEIITFDELYERASFIVSKV